MSIRPLLELLEKIEYKKLLDNTFGMKKDITKTYNKVIQNEGLQASPFDRMNNYLEKVINNNERNDFNWVKELPPENKVHFTDFLHDLFENNNQFIAPNMRNYERYELNRPLNEIISEVNDRDFRLGTPREIITNNDNELLRNLVKDNQNIENFDNDDELFRTILQELNKDWRKIK